LTYSGIPEITEVSYDLWQLRVTLKFENLKWPVYIIFEEVVGFRVLNESDLLEFWSKDSRAESWLWQIENGGWLDLENLRKGFISGKTGQVSEFLITGIEDCISIISRVIPTISEPNS